MRRILVVEDEPEIQELLLAYLRNEGDQVTVAGDGREALECFRSGTFDLVLLDVLLPGDPERIHGAGDYADCPGRRSGPDSGF